MKKDWYEGDVNSILKSFGYRVDSYHLTRPIYIYCIVNKLVGLNNDYKNCENHTTKKLIEQEMQKIASELRNYKVYDERFEEIYDDGK